MATTFLLLLLVVQVAMAMTMRSTADAAVTAAARRASLPDNDLDAEGRDLARTIAAIVPGAGDVTAEVRLSDSTATAVARFRWHPPGPVLTAFDIRVRARVPRVHEP